MGAGPGHRFSPITQGGHQLRCDRCEAHMGACFGPLAGMLCATGMVMLICRFTNWPSVWWGAPLLGITVFATSLCGDLIESSMKRDAGVKVRV